MKLAIAGVLTGLGVLTLVLSAFLVFGWEVALGVTGLVLLILGLLVVPVTPMPPPPRRRP